MDNTMDIINYDIYIIIAGCVFITGICVGMVCCAVINGGIPNRCMTGIITTTSKGNLCGLPGSVETDELGEIKKPRKRGGCL